MIEPVFTEVATLGDLLLRAAHARPDRDALVLPGTRASYSHLRDGAVRVARALIALGVRRGSNVGLLIPNSVEFAEALFGVALAGCVAVPLNARHKDSELGYIVRDAELAALLTSRHADDPVDFSAVLTKALSPLASADRSRNLPILALVRGEAPGFLSAAQFRAGADGVEAAAVESARRRVRLRDPALIIYTSGTTANPKGCVLGHEAVTRGPVERARYRLNAGDHTVTWGAGPLFHIGSLAPLVGSVGVAGTYLADLYFEPGRALKLMADEGVTLAWPWFSAIVQGLIDHPNFDPAALRSLRHLFLIAPPALVERVQRLLPHTEILQACGMTETAGVFALSDPDETFESRSTTNGRPSPGVEVRIVDPGSGHDQPHGAMGEIWVRGYNVMEGYWRSPEKTAEALTSNGWLRTGDLYTQHAGGGLVFGGRLKDMLKVGGENVATMEVEAFLCSHPDIQIAEVVGRPDPRLDEVPVAFVQLREGAQLSVDDVIAHCRGRIASYKVPRAVHFMSADEWPMSATKIDKRGLQQRLAHSSANTSGVGTT